MDIGIGLPSTIPGVTRDQVVAATGWAIRFSDDLAVTDELTSAELETLRSLQAA